MNIHYNEKSRLEMGLLVIVAMITCIFSEDFRDEFDEIIAPIDWTKYVIPK